MGSLTITPLFTAPNVNTLKSNKTSTKRAVTIAVNKHFKT